MGWKQKPDGTMVYVDETGAEKSYGDMQEAGQPSADSPYARALTPVNAPAGGAGFGSGMAPKGAAPARAAIDSQNAAASPKPDGWPGWRWDGAKWSDAHDPTGHSIWVTNSGSGGNGGNVTWDGSAIAASAAARQAGTNDIVDRYSAIQMDTGPADQAREQQQQALDMQKAIYDKLLSYDPTAESDAASKRAMSRGLAMARSSGGGAASRQAAQFQAIQQSPAIQAAAADQANQQAQRNTQLAAQAASQYAQTAAGTRSQDIQQAQAEVDTGINVANGISNAIGRDMQITSDEAKFLGQMQTVIEKLNIDWASLDEATRAAKVEEALRKEGLDQQWKMFKKSQDVGVLDVVGAVVGTARAGVGTYAQGKGAGLW